MSATVQASLEEQARTLSGLLRDYAEKLHALNEEIISFFEVEHVNEAWTLSRTAWLLDRCDLIRPPLENIMSRASQLVEHGGLDSLTQDEISLRLTDVEIHLHHVVRQAFQLRGAVRREKDELAKMRLAAGLNAAKGGPLRPND